MTFDARDAGPPYVRLVQVIKGRIASGEFVIGDQLPAARDLAKQYGVAENTVLNAVRALRKEGIVSSQQGKGTFVLAIPSDQPAPSAEFVAIMGHLERLQATVEQVVERLDKLEKS